MTTYKSLQPGWFEDQAKKSAAYKAARTAKEKTEGETDVAKIIDANTPRTLNSQTSNTQVTQNPAPQAAAMQGMNIPASNSASNSAYNTPTSTVPAITTQRDYNREAEAIKKIGASSNEAMNLDPKKLFEMTYTPKELENMEDYKALSKYQTAKQSLLETPQPTNTMMAALEDALRIKSDPAKQQMGVSELYQAAGIPTEGVSGYTTLMASLNNQSQIMGSKYDSFVNQLTKTAGAMRDTYNTVADTYNLLKTDYDRQAQYMQNLVMQIQSQEQAMSMLDRQYALDKEAQEWAINNPSYSEVTSRMAVESDIAERAKPAQAVDNAPSYSDETSRLKYELDKKIYEDSLKSGTSGTGTTGGTSVPTATGTTEVPKEFADQWLNSPASGKSLDQAWAEYQAQSPTTTKTVPKTGIIPTANADSPEKKSGFWDESYPANKSVQVKVPTGTAEERRAKLAVKEASQIVGAMTSAMTYYTRNPKQMIELWTGLASTLYETWYPGKIAKEEAMKNSISKLEEFYLMTGIAKPNDIQLNNIKKYDVEKAIEMELEAQVQAGLMDAQVKQRILEAQQKQAMEQTSVTDDLDQKV